jgi:predicted acetyltransferase
MISLTPATPEQKTLMHRLMQLYLYDFTEFTGDEISDDGFFPYPYLVRYWEEPGRYPFLVQVDEKVAGFVLVRATEEAGVVVHHIAEFFVLKKYRRQKIGRLVAWKVFDLFPGNWRVFEIPENLPAQVFWRKTIGEYTGGQFHEENDPEDGSPVQVFNNLNLHRRSEEWT